MVSEAGRRRLLTVSLAVSVLTALLSSSALITVLVAWPLGVGWVRVARPASTALLALLALDAALGLAVAVRSALLALACRARAAPRQVRLLHPVSAHLVCLLMPSVLLHLAVVVWCVVGMALSPRLSRSRILWAALGYYEEAAAREALDEAQAALECCGFDGPADWHPWANDPIGRLGLKDQDSDAVRAASHDPDKRLARPADGDIPESCCAPDAAAPVAAMASAPPRSDATAACRTWERGCFKPLVNTLVLLHLSVGTASLFLAALHSVAAATLRLAQTSGRAALEAGDPDAPAPAWLFRPPRSPGEDGVAMTGFSSKPGDDASPRRSRSGGRRGHGMASDSDPDQPGKLLFSRAEIDARRARALASTSTSTDSSLTFELSETPLPTSEERFILAEYAFSPGPSLGTSTTSSWTLTSDAESIRPSGETVAPRSPTGLRRARSDGDIPQTRGSLWDGSPFRPVRKPPAVCRKDSTVSQKSRAAAELSSESGFTAPLPTPPTPMDRGDKPADASPILGRADTLLGLEMETKALMQAAMLGAVPLAVQPRRPSRITSESSTQTNVGQSILQLDDLFREHGITSRTLSRTEIGDANVSQRPATMHGAEVLASGDTLPEQNGPGKILTTTCDTSRVSENPVEVPRGASWSTSASTLAQEDAPTPMLQAVEDEYTRVELDCVPLPPLPPSARGRVASRVRSRAEHREPSSSSGSEASCRNDAPRHFAWGRPRKRPTARKLSSRAKGMWGHGTDHWMSPWASRAGGTSSSSSATVPTSSTTDSSSSSTSPTAPSATVTDSSSSSSSPESPLPTAPPASPPRSTTSLEDAIVVRTASARQEDARRSLWDITVAMSKSTVTVALVQTDRSVLYRIPLVWLLSELGVCANNENTKALLNFGGGGCSHAPVTVNVARMFRPLEGEDDLARVPLGRLPKESPSRMPTAAEQATLTLMRPWHGDGALAALKDADARPAHLTAALCQGPRGPRGVAASKWTRKCRRKTTLALRELFRDGGLVSVLHRVRTAPGLPASDAGAAVRREADCPAVHSAPVLSTAASCPRPEPPCSSTQLTLDRRKSPPPPPPPRASPRRRGRKRSLSLGSEPLAKLPARVPEGSYPPQRTHVETTDVRHTAADHSVSLASTSSFQCPHCDCWRPSPGRTPSTPSSPPPSPPSGPGSSRDDSSDISDECPCWDVQGPAWAAARASEPAVRSWIPPEAHGR